VNSPSARAATAVDRNTLVDLATDALRAELLAGRLPAGTRIHLEATAARLGMSPIPVREALRTLATQGLVLSLPHRGYRVPEATLADLEDMYRLRLLLDPMAVEIAVPKLTEEQLNRAEDSLAALEDAFRSGDWDAIRSRNRDFHFAIYDAADSPWLLRLISMLWENSERYRRLAAPRRGTPQQRASEHRAILDACRERAPEQASALMHEHLYRTYAMARQALDRPE
jgi:DNA-binding GntR family transcriptional regulator